MTRPLPLPDRPLVLDGGLGTLLEARGHDLSDPLWSARVLADEPDAVRAAHEEYFRAGADVAITASYQVGFAAFAQRGLDAAATEELLRASVRLAAEARDRVARDDAGAPRERWVAASVGPYGATLGDGSEYRGSSGLTRAELGRWHAPRFAVLADAGADLLACETIPSLDEGAALVDLARGSGAAVWLAFTVADGRLRSGEPMREGFALAEEADEVVAVGINCAHPDEVPAAIAAARSATDRPVVVYPNSGERWDAVARGWHGDPALPSVEAWIRAGASLVGGCCRVGPDEIRRMRDALG
ncbi:homocysteine S-methyltransferase [Clavibacter sp. B3I6]|uniref:homocysteine S-methyltransferase n=1 Tax=Clavibacter sp. B3I6 TaxID=3042268 RepID=UPI0027878BAA|nr:homocysteine S-methyltransferase [Clavibacter sp. B3I6]MDQ0744969.1 homocysteine S-methyltransferase [Clavibacter sp. B3I6]